MSIETFRHLELYCKAPADTLLIRHVSGTERLSQCFEYTLTLFGTNHDLKMESLLGEHASVHIKLLGHDRFFDGIVTELSHAGTSGRYALYRMTLRPWLWVLSQTQTCRIFQNLTTLEIVKEVIGNRGEVDEALFETYKPRSYCVQYLESDLTFISRLLEDEGIYYYFRHEQSKHTLVLADSISAHQPAPNCDTLRFGRLESEDRPPGVFYEWNTTKRIRPGEVVLTDYDYLKPDADLRVYSQDRKSHALSTSKHFDYPGGYTEVAIGETRSRVRVEEFAAGHELAHGTTDCVGLRTGDLVKLEDHPRRDQNKEYLIIGADYEMDSGSFESGDPGTRTLFTAEVALLDKRVRYRPARTTRAPRIAGAQTATVVGPQGQEIWTDELGRVKVKFHWDRAPWKDADCSCWVRVASGWAGSQFGLIHIPRIGQEVVVEFLEGDPDRPLITASVYNQRNKPPFALPAHQTQSGLKTQSSKGGNTLEYNELRFEDDKGNEQVWLQAQKDLDILVKHAMSVTVNESGHETLVAKGDMTTDVPVGLYRVTAEEILLQVDGFKLHMTNAGITLSVGGSTVELTPALVRVNGTMIKLNS